MARLFVKCKSCGKTFSTGLDLPPGITFSGNRHRCSECNKTNVYEQTDYLREVTDKKSVN
jgi:transposase-like protein